MYTFLKEKGFEGLSENVANRLKCGFSGTDADNLSQKIEKFSNLIVRNVSDQSPVKQQIEDNIRKNIAQAVLLTVDNPILGKL